MYIIKGAVMFAILNIDVADKNPKYKVQNDIDTEKNISSSNLTYPRLNNSIDNGGPKNELNELKKSSLESDIYNKENKAVSNNYYGNNDDYQPQVQYKPKANFKNTSIFYC
jgi:hypothetical protein